MQLQILFAGIAECNQLFLRNLDVQHFLDGTLIFNANFHHAYFSNNKVPQNKRPQGTLESMTTRCPEARISFHPQEIRRHGWRADSAVRPGAFHPD